MPQKARSSIKLFIYLIISLVLLIGLVTFVSLKSSDASKTIVRSWNIKNDARKLESYFLNAETGQRGFLLTNETNYLEPYYEARSNFDQELKEIEEFVKDYPEQIQKLKSIDSIAKLKFDELALTITLANSGQMDEAIELVDSDIGNKYTETIRIIFDDFVAQENNYLQERLDTLDLYNSLKIFLLVLAVAFTILSVYFLFLKVNPLIVSLIRTESELIEANTKLEDNIDKLKATNQINTLIIQENSDLIESLKTKNEQLDHFAYIASHDLQEPLRTVSNFTELLREDYEDKLDDDAKKYFNFIDGALDRMRRLIAGLLSYSRLGTSETIKDVDLNDVLREVIENCNVQIEKSEATVNSDNLPTVSGYKIELTQLFQNLLSNALKFRTEDRKTIIDIFYREEKDFHNISITDNGIGIKKRDLNKIFDMFSRLNNSKKFEGQGIGLAFCKKIVELHHGEMWVASDYGKGTTFHFTLKKNFS